MKPLIIVTGIVTSYLILDDDVSLFTSTERVYNVNAKTGLTNYDVRVIIKKYKKGGVARL